MNITRVERDGVEFFTVDETGESGMSESGLARLCGVSPVSIHKFVSSSTLTWDQEKALNPAFRKTIAFKPGSGKNLKSSQFKHQDSQCSGLCPSDSALCSGVKI